MTFPIKDSISRLQGLPKDVILTVLEQISSTDKAALAVASKYFNSVAVSSANDIERMVLQKFLQRLIDSLAPERHTEQQQAIQHLLELMPQNFSGLSSLKDHFLSVKRQLTVILGSLETADEIAQLIIRAEKYPAFMENIIASSISEALFNSVYQAVLESGHIDRALEMTNIFINPTKKSFCLHGICESLTNAENFDRAFQIANTIPDLTLKAVAISKISGALTDAGNYERAFQIASTITDSGALSKSTALGTICKALTNTGNFDRATQIANAIPDPLYESCNLREVCEALARAGDFDRALQIANTLPDRRCTPVALYQISKALDNAGYFDRAHALRSTIPNWRIIEEGLEYYSTGNAL